MSGRPTYLGPHSRPLAGWLHLPSGNPRAAALLCPSLGLEALAAHQTYRRLADGLAAEGIAALRLDYDGTGDSAGSQRDPDRVAAWTGSVEEGVRELRSAGAACVLVIGMRAGALIALEAAERCRPEALVLWDPPLNGRSFLREQRALRLIAVDQPVTDDGSIEGPGAVFDEATVADFASLGLRLTPAAEGSPAVLVLGRASRRDASALGQTCAAAGAELAEAVGQAELLDVLPDEARVPDEAVRRIVEWCTRVAAVKGTPAPLALARREEAHVLADGGRPVVERFTRLGPAGLFAVIAEPADRVARATVLVSNAGVIPHVGPARAWVELARVLAGGGLRVARIDQSGIGDSPPRSGRPEHLVYASEALDDFVDAATALSPTAPSEVVLGGLCSGAYHAIEVGRLLRSRLVWAVNPILTFAPAEVAEGRPLDRRRSAAQPLRRPLRALPKDGAVAGIGEWLPPPAWWLLDRLNLQPSPGRGLERLAGGGADLLLICGKEDAKPFLRRARGSLRRLQREGNLRFAEVPGLDHTMLARGGREAALGILTKELLGRLAGPQEDGDSPTGTASSRRPASRVP